ASSIENMSDRGVVTVRGLRKTYGKRVVVDGVDLTVHPGEIVGLVGANGAGKTTTVGCIQGLRRPDAGGLRVSAMTPSPRLPGCGRWLAASCRTRRCRIGCG